MSAKILRAAPKPSRFAKLVNDCIEQGLNPKTKNYEPKWFKAKHDDECTMALMQKCAEALDDMIKNGFISDDWDTHTELCRNFQQGKCRRGNKCPFKHSGNPVSAAPRRGNPAAEKATNNQIPPPGKI